MQYYKVINTKYGHHGYSYKLGINIDPRAIKPIEKVYSCGIGAFYFVEAKHLHEWAEMGDSIAWITPLSKVVKDEDKFKAHKINVTKILDVEKALPLIRGLSIRAWDRFGVDMPKGWLDKQLIHERIEHMIEEDEIDKNFIQLVTKHASNRKVQSIVSELEWTTTEIRQLIKAQAPSKIIMNHDTMNNLFRYEAEGNRKLIETLMNYDPGLFLTRALENM